MRMANGEMLEGIGQPAVNYAAVLAVIKADRVKLDPSGGGGLTAGRGCGFHRLHHALHAGHVGRHAADRGRVQRRGAGSDRDCPLGARRLPGHRVSAPDGMLRQHALGCVLPPNREPRRLLATPGSAAGCRHQLPALRPTRSDRRAGEVRLDVPRRRGSRSRRRPAGAAPMAPVHGVLRSVDATGRHCRRNPAPRSRRNCDDQLQRALYARPPLGSAGPT